MEGATNFRLTIWNRWGEMVFETNSGESWDGMQGGKPAVSDVYLYLIEVEVDDEEDAVKVVEFMLKDPRQKLVQFFLDRLFRPASTEGSPESIRTRSTCDGVGRQVGELDRPRGLVPCLNRVGDEFDGAVTHQDVSTALVATAGRSDAG